MEGGLIYRERGFAVALSIVYFDYSDYTFCSMGAMVQLVEGWGTDEIEEANFYVSDAAQLDSVIAEVQKISSINWNNFNITANDEVYQNIRRNRSRRQRRCQGRAQSRAAPPSSRTVLFLDFS